MSIKFNEPIEIFVICYEPTPALESCLESIHKYTFHIEHRVVVIEGRRSAAENRNIALSQASSPWFVMMDDDVIVTPGWLEKMLTYADDAIGQIQPKLLLPNNQIFAAEKVFTTPWGDNAVLGRGEEDNGQFDYIRIAELLSGTCCLYNTKIIKSCAFDTSYKGSQWEDCDFSMQIVRNGFYLLYCGKAKVYHQHLYRSPGNTNFEYFKNKWFGKRELTRRGVLYVGFACDVNCIFCYYRFVNSKTFRSFNELKKECNRFKRFYRNTHVDITGGEPTIYPNIIPLVEYCRDILLKPTIITHGQKLSRDLVKDLKQAGIEDFLISYHGPEKEHDYLIGKKDGYKAMRRGIENVNEAGLPFRINTVVTKYNYKVLPTLAYEFLEIKPKVVNFIMFNPFEGWIDIKCQDFQARYSEAVLHLREAILILDSKNVEVHLRYAPFCLFPGLEKYIMNFPQLPFDKWEWSFRYGHVLKDEYDYLYYAMWQSRERYTYCQPCYKCALKLMCSGLPKQYNQAFGCNELRSRGGTLIRDPIYFNTLKYNSSAESQYYNGTSLVCTIQDFITAHPWLKDSDPLLLHEAVPIERLRLLQETHVRIIKRAIQKFSNIAAKVSQWPR